MVKPVPGLTIEQQPEPVVIRCLLWGEARGERPRGKLAVLWVLHNRAMKEDSTLRAEALKPLQFSCFNLSDPNRDKLLKAYVLDFTQWAVCDAIASVFESSNTTDPTGAATHYYVAEMTNPPAWGRGNDKWIETAVIGSHCFGRAA